MRIAAQLLSSYLLIWAPGTFAVELLTALPSIGMRGTARVVELGVHGLVAIVCAVAGRMMRIGTPAASAAGRRRDRRRARAIAIQSLFWTVAAAATWRRARGVPFAVLACINAWSGWACSTGSDRRRMASGG